MCLYHHRCDVVDTNWVDVDSIIFIVTMNYEKEKNIYWLNCLYAKNLDCKLQFFSFQLYSMLSFLL